MTDLADMTNAHLIAAAREMREAARCWETISHHTVAFGSWSQNRTAAQRFLDALAAWDHTVQPWPVAGETPETAPRRRRDDH
jgi:hypothetical protein